MKKLFTILLLFSSTIYGQGLFEFFKLTADDDNPEKFDRIVVDINFNNWLNAPPGVDQKLYSVGGSFYWYKDIPLGEKSNVAVAYGIGLDYHNVYSNGAVQYDVDGEGNIFTDLTPIKLPPGYTINKATFKYVEVPVELRLRTMNRSKEERMGFNFKLYLGFKAGYLLGNNMKYRDNENKIKLSKI